VKLRRRQFLHLAAGAAALPAISRIAWAQAYPSRPVRVIVGFPAGGAADIFARLIGQYLSERFGQQFIIENRPGAASNIAIEAVVRARPDGYTLVSVNAVNPINATLYEKLNFNLITDIAPVAAIVRAPIVLLVNPLVPAKTVPEFTAYAKANPGKISMASPGIGTPGHVAGELFKMMTGVNIQHVPYRGQAPALTDLLGGQVQVAFMAMPGAIEYIRAGKLRALAVTGATRGQDPQETCAGQDFRDAKMNQCGQRLRDRSPRGRSQPERVRRIGAPMNVSEKDTRDVARIWTDRRIPAACRGAVFHDQIVESSWSRSPRLSRVKSIFPCRPCMAIAWADISAVMSPRQYLGMAVRSEETSTIQPDVVRHQRGAQSRPFSEPRDRTASGAGTSGRPSGTLPVQPARNML